MSVAESQTICGFSLIDGSICMTTAVAIKDFCGVHKGLRCTSCGQRAVQYCRGDMTDHGPCAKPLCERCEHRLGGGHGRRATVRETARQELIQATVLSLQDAEENGQVKILVFPEQVAARLIDQLSMHIMIKLLSGMAQPPS